MNKRNNNNSVPLLKIGSNEIEDSGKIANEFNKLFVSVASKIKEPIENSDFGKLKDFCDTEFQKMFNLQFQKFPEMKLKNI